MAGGLWRCTWTDPCQRRARKANPSTRAERRKVVAELTWEGWTLDAIAARLNVTPRTVSRDRDELKITQPWPSRFTDDEYRRAQELLDDGYSLQEVARTLHRNVETIAKRFRGRGWSPEQTGQYNRLLALRKQLDV